MTLPVANHHQSGEAETAATFDDLGTTIDMDNPVGQVQLIGIEAKQRLLLYLKNKAGFTGSVGTSLHAAVIQETVTVKDHLFDVLFQGFFCNSSPDRLGGIHIASILLSFNHFLGDGRGGDKGLAGGILDDLGIYVPGAAKNAEPGAFTGPAHLAPYPDLPLYARLTPSFCDTHSHSPWR
jgi:hypothetical protein